MVIWMTFFRLIISPNTPYRLRHTYTEPKQQELLYLTSSTRLRASFAKSNFNFNFYTLCAHIMVYISVFVQYDENRLSRKRQPSENERTQAYEKRKKKKIHEPKRNMNSNNGTYTQHRTEHTQQITATMWNSTIGACVLIQLYMDLWLCVRKYSINNEADKRNPKLPLMQTLRYNSEFGSCDRLVVWKCVFNVELQYRLEFWFRQSPFSNNLARHNKHSMA